VLKTSHLIHLFCRLTDNKTVKGCTFRLTPWSTVLESVIIPRLVNTVSVLSWKPKINFRLRQSLESDEFSSRSHMLKLIYVIKITLFTAMFEVVSFLQMFS
jgi:hypothetical protein